MTVLVTGVGVVLPGGGRLADLGRTEAGSLEPVDPRSRINRRGLRYKDRATQLAFCAAEEALNDAGLYAPAAEAPVRAEIGIVVSSNFGNLDTVCRVTGTIGAEGTLAASPMDLPNASSNVIASSLAIRFGLAGANLMLCSGATSGLDALSWGRRLITAGRCRQVLVLGTEPDNETVREFTDTPRMLDGAVGVVLEDAGTAAARGAVPRLTLGTACRGGTLADCVAVLAAHGAPARWYPPEAVTADVLDGLFPGATRVDLAQVWGASSGALGVLQCAAAIGWFDGGGAGPVYAVTGGGRDSAAGHVFTAPPGVAR
ncbi:beta-ketoacyl synthase N-terminal-like domain-containing protein [Micromonospora tarensis]|uniref:Beta-ketoacyl synthase-like N-terminal domain-containing protein n=1 Tax=Micromonospora tarensis TaxID=2806100 RepID=A0ABS1YLK7_9ACTN|nr:beta-ketoacyl synthase N-terminal-like domain-containing protein [Micromonospora tarensis]MBM0278026.1 hypothetical protein [Micromonospora tarensis]